MMRGKDFILIGLQPWGMEVGSNFKNMAREIAKHNRVLYVNLPLNIKGKLLNVFNSKNGKRSNLKPGLFKENNQLYVYTPDVTLFSINWLERGGLFDFLNCKNAEILCNSISGKASSLGFKNFVLMNDSLMFIGKYVKELLHPDLYLYYIRDNLVQQPYFLKHGAYLEPETCRTADAVIANSDYLAAYARNYNEKSYMVGQGCEINYFNPEKVKKRKAIKSSSRPLIGYVGNLTATRLDIKLLENLANRRPDWQFVFIGPEDKTFAQSKLHACSNVSFLGTKPVEELPELLLEFDVCLNPQLVNSNTIGNYPRKIDEYLAMGKPVVATNTTAMTYFKDHTFLANNEEEYVLLIEKALNEDSEVKQRERIKCANSHTWTNCVNLIFDKIEKQLPPLIPSGQGIQEVRPSNGTNLTQSIERSFL